jgi:general secretion pathway protein E
MDIRVSILPVVYGERVVMRLLDKSRTFADLAHLGMSSRDFTQLSQAIAQPNGIIFMTGPTGSGKTSTLYSILHKLNHSDVNIITVEDPVEYQMNGIGQVQVQEKIDVTFAAALRSILRQDPDIVMIGEIRDTETAQIAIQAALTGHLVLSTLHTNSAAATIIRLVDMGIERFLIASTVICIIAQRLVRTLCNVCKQAYTPDSAQIALLGLSAKQLQSITFFKAVGCEECMHAGYKGRVAIFEVLTVTAELSRLITEQADARTLQRKAREQGMRLLVEDGIDKIAQGITTIEEVLSEATFREEGA